MPDKYDEAATEIYRDLDLDGQEDFDRVLTILRSFFPPPAEDSRQLAEKYSDADGCMLSTLAIEKLAAEIESFAQSRVEPWREALRDIIGILPADLPSCYCRDCLAVRKARALLSDSPAKEATP